LKFNASLSYTKRKSYYGAQQDPNAYGETWNPVFSGNIVYNNFSVKNHSFVGGLSYKSDSLNDKAPAYNRVIDVVYSDLGLFIQDEIDLFKGSTSLLVGVRGDKHSEISSMIVSPRASIIYKGFNDLTLRATFSTGFRAPQVFDEDLHITMVGGDARLIRNRDGLKEEKSRSFTVGIDYGKQTMNRLFQVSLGGFYNQINNVFTLGKAEILSNAHIFERFNGASARVYGVEVEAGFKFAGKFEVFSGWTFQTSKLDDPDPDFGSTKLFRSPDIYGSLRLEYNVPKLATLRTELKYTGSMNVPHYRGYISEDKLETSKAFVVMDFSASKRIDFGKGGVTVVASIVNVFDRFQEDLDRGAFRDAGYIYGPRLPRTFRIGLKYDF
ncbi:MAG: TonB-dependent receptor, partial [bacterium]|nr:TonB-dependent receptor [bacterium]